MAYPYLGSDGCLREALLSQVDDLLVLGQTLFSLRLTHLSPFGILFRGSFAPPWKKAWSPLTPDRLAFDEPQDGARETLQEIYSSFA